MREYEYECECVEVCDCVSGSLEVCACVRSLSLKSFDLLRE